MKCSKCGYLGFETGDRCRNCGYDFSLGNLLPREGTEAVSDLPIRTGSNTPEPLADFRLNEVPGDALPLVGTTPALDLDRMIGAAGQPSPASESVSGREADGGPRPGEGLFPGAGSDLGEPLARLRGGSRPPLSVRRAAPEVPRLRPRPTPHGRTTPRPAGRHARAGAFDGEALPLGGLDLEPGSDRAPDGAGACATPLPRLCAALLDLAVVGTIDGAVLYFTLRLLGLTFADMAVLPWIPLGGFLLLLDGGYFVVFAAVGGQTIGQMACRLKLVGRDGSPPAFGIATVCTLAWVVSTLPLGLGPWFALRPDRLALHDRLTSTRVIAL